MRNILFTAALAAGLAGCVGGIDSPTGSDPGPGSDPGNNPGSDTTNPPPTDTPPATDAGKASKKLFDDNVYPILKGKCGACHGQAAPLPNAPGFVSADATKGYTTAASSGALMGNLTPSGAPILSLIKAGHQNATYTTDETSKITAWLAAETTARAGGQGGEDPNSPTAIITRLENQWSACMTIANFTSANMAAWAQVNSNDGNNNNARCESCHNLGYEGFTANGVAQAGFDIISSERLQMKQYFTVDSVTTPTKIIVNQANLQAVATGTEGHIGHRRFNLTNNQGLTAMTALNNFYNLTMTAVAAGTCGPTKLK